jgi:hypothetical protein
MQLAVEREPLYRRVPGRDMLEVAEEGVVLAGDLRLRLPVGHRTDGASIPRGAWAVVAHPFAGPVLLPATVHDLLYERQGRVSLGTRLSRARVDQLFYDMLWVELVLPREVRAAMAPGGWRWLVADAAVLVAAARCWVMWAAVRLFGRRSW